jgi:hypothetical protein
MEFVVRKEASFSGRNSPLDRFFSSHSIAKLSLETKSIYRTASMDRIQGWMAPKWLTNRKTEYDDFESSFPHSRKSNSYHTPGVVAVVLTIWTLVLLGLSNPFVRDSNPTSIQIYSADKLAP